LHRVRQEGNVLVTTALLNILCLSPEVLRDIELRLISHIPTRYFIPRQILVLNQLSSNEDRSLYTEAHKAMIEGTLVLMLSKIVNQLSILISHLLRFLVEAYPSSIDNTKVITTGVNKLN
jgi:hypothetical protein